MSDEKQQNQAAEAAAAEGAAEPVPEAGTVEAEARVAQLESEVAQLKDQLLRAMAETENVRRRLEQQAEDRGKYAIGNFARDVLLVADNLRRALDSVPQSARQDNELVSSLTVGVEMTERELLTALERYGVKPVPALGARFDPNLHQAMMEVDDPSQPAGTVVMVMQSGYTIHDRLLRPAMVGVSKGGPKAPAGQEQQPEGPQGEASPRVDTRV
jgi:molecular chaperone GrpE